MVGEAVLAPAPRLTPPGNRQRDNQVRLPEGSANRHLIMYSYIYMPYFFTEIPCPLNLFRLQHSL